MHFRFSAAPSGGLKVIPEIEDFRLCWLEGGNGIGKTVAIRLLELVTGAQPYEGNPAAWGSLKKHLGIVHVSISGLRNGDVLELTLDPEKWPDQPTRFSDLGSASLNGQSINFEQVKDHLQVFRVGGDETVTTRLQDSLRAERAMAQRNKRILEQFSDRLHEAADRLLRDVSPFSEESLQTLTSHIEEITENRASVADELPVLQDRMAKLQELLRIESALTDIRVQGPGLEESLKTLEERIQEVESLKREVEKRQRVLQPSADAQIQRTRDLKKLNNLRAKQLEKASTAIAKADQAAEALGLSAESQEFDQAIVAAREEIESLSRVRVSIVPSAELVSLVETVRSDLSEAEGTSIDEDVAALFEKTRVTVLELRRATEARLEELAKESRNSRVDLVDAKLAEWNKRVSDIQQAGRLLITATRDVGKLSEIESQIEELVKLLDSESEENYSALTRELQTLEESRIKSIEERARLQVTQGALTRLGSESFLQGKVDFLTEELGLVGTASADLQRTSEKISLDELELEQLDTGLKQAREQLSDYLQELGSVVQLFQGSSDYESLRTRVGGHLPQQHHSDIQNVRALEKLKLAVAKLLDHLDDIANLAASLEGGLTELMDAVGGQQISQSSQVKTLAGHFEREFGDLLRDPEIQATLFGGGKFDSMDLLRGEVSWIDRVGALQRRPLEAFSSGELAFAYVLASILQRSTVTAKNQVLVLDEFGAFIESGRLTRLLKFLHERVLAGQESQQVIIVLPLRLPIRSEGKKSLETLQTEVAARGYFCQEVSAT